MEAPITSWPVPPNARRALLVGGTFDPPHAGHIQSALHVRDGLSDPAERASAWIVYVPAAEPPLKGRDDVSPSVHRLAMLRLALQGNPRCAVWTDEIDRAAWSASRGDAPTPSYWIDTLHRARRVAGGASMSFIIGCDQAEHFHAWREPRAILALAEPIVLLRRAGDTPELLRRRMEQSRFWTQDELEHWRTWTRPSSVPDVDATSLRAAILAGRTPSPNVLSESVLAYIRRERLYSHAGHQTP